ncbi:MAG: hypothetical protein ACK4IX_11175 [Candidatus Sericytochromatia bacterium]
MKLFITSLLGLAFLISSNTLSYAETDSDCEILRDLTYLSVGGNMLNLNALNASTGYPALPSEFLTWGSGGRNISGRVVTGADSTLSLFDDKSVSSDGNRAYLSFASKSILSFGYVVNNDDNLKIYPNIGLGIGTLTMDIYDKSKLGTFKELLKNPQKGVSITNTSIITDFGISADYISRIGKSKKFGGVAFGAKIGYVWTPYSFGFGFKDQKVEGVPNISNDGPYVKVYLGYTDNIVKALLDIF